MTDARSIISCETINRNGRGLMRVEVIEVENDAHCWKKSILVQSREFLLVNIYPYVALKKEANLACQGSLLAESYIQWKKEKLNVKSDASFWWKNNKLLKKQQNKKRNKQTK